MKCYPVSLKLKGRKVLLFGGGKISLRKLTGLLEAGAVVKVISKHFLPQFNYLAEAGEITLLKDEYAPGQIQDAFLVIAATNEKNTNKAIAHEAFQKNILVNDCSDAANSSFTNPATWENKGVVVSFSTEGVNPRLAKEFKRHCMNKCQLKGFTIKEIVDENRDSLSGWSGTG